MTAISWTDETWNPTVGCARVSAGCINCYAEHAAAMVNRTQGERSVYRKLLRVVDGAPRWNGEVTFLPERLDIPLRWRKGRRVFVNSMSDLFHEKLTNEQIAAVFGVMAACPQHTFQVLTKRAARMRDWFAWLASQWSPNGSGPVNVVLDHAIFTAPPVNDEGDHHAAFAEAPRGQWPLPNVHLGVSVENREAMLERAPLLLETPAAVRFWSAEPLIADLGDVSPWLPDWLIVGCESGPGMRRADPAWYRALRDQCASAGKAFFFKQGVEAVPPEPDEDPRQVGYPSHADMLRAFNNPPTTVTCGPGSRRKKQGVIELPYLDGVQHAAFPVASGEGAQP